ncbi:MAG: methyl-accepting chemotaxis protein [Gallionellaceae bacterium]|nr:methyl-accepting chemotaxis protein [Gallionellaceae bacterium]
MAFKPPSAKQPDAIGKSFAREGTFNIPFISRLPIGKQLQLLGGALITFLLLAVVAAYLDNRAAAHGTRYVVESSKLLMLSQRMAKAAERSLSGDYLAFEELTKSREAEIAILDLLDKGDSSLPATSGRSRLALNELTARANKTLADAVTLEGGRPGLVTLSRAIAAMDASSHELRNLTQQLVARTDGAQKERAIRFSLLIERMSKDATAMLGEVSAEQVSALGLDTIEAGEVLATFPAGDALVTSIRDLFDGYRVSAEAIIGNAQNLLSAKRAGRAIFTDSEQLLEYSQKLTDAYQASLSNRISSYLMAGSGIMVVLLLLLLSKVYLEDSTRRAQEAERSNRRNQDAILRLMNEMGDLADGDLTVKVTVSEDVTGAIADSVNYTTDELRKLVSGITTVSEQVTQAAGAAEVISKGLLEAAGKQSDEIRFAGEAVGLITKSIQEVDASAAQSLQVARRTLEVTVEGAQAVQNTIIGMDEIREQIQETSKRIKRLGESSQEIGEIVDLISDIT